MRCTTNPAVRLVWPFFGAVPVAEIIWEASQGEGDQVKDLQKSDRFFSSEKTVKTGATCVLMNKMMGDDAKYPTFEVEQPPLLCFGSQRPSSLGSKP